MKKLVEEFTSHLKEGLEISESVQFKDSHFSPKNVLICGLGGSGIGGKIVSQLVQDSCKVSVSLTNDYSIPNFVDKDTLVIACSYSGNTEETISAVKQSVKKGAELSCICSGGELQTLAQTNNSNCIVIPGGLPPRSAFGYSFVQLFTVFNKYNLIDTKFKTNINSGISLLENNISEIKTSAIKVAQSLEGKTPVIYSNAKFEGVAIRCRQQINENSKVLCWHHVLPEMNHNELVGWAGGSDQIAVLILDPNNMCERTIKRLDICKEVFNKHTSTINHVVAKGTSDIERTLYLIHLVDWISVYLADIKNVDPVEVDIITYLKGELAKL